MARTEIVVAERFGRVIVFRRIGTCMERRRVLVCTVTIFAGRYGHCGDRMDRRENVVRLGTEEQVQAALAQSRCSRKINTAFIERQNGTDRNRCSRKVRKSYCFSKDWDVHGAATCFSLYSYNFCWAVRTLRRPDGQKGKCSPAMSAGLSDHLWTIKEWLQFPVCKWE